MRNSFSLLLLIAIISLHTLCCSAQNEGNVWIIGSSPENTIFNGYQWGNTVIDFADIEPSIYYDSLVTMDFSRAVSSVSDAAGNLQLYSNGLQLHGNDHQAIIGGDTIAHSDFWDLWSIPDYYPDGRPWVVGHTIPQNIIILPLPGATDKYILLYQIRTIENNTSDATSFNYSIVEKNQDGLLEVTVKDAVIDERLYDGGTVQASRHANGRDWWVIQCSEHQEQILTYLVTPTDVQLVHTKEKEALSTNTLSQAAFSPDGQFYAIANGHSVAGPWASVVWLYEFDRCSGNLSGIGRDTILTADLYGTVAFSSNSKFLYTSEYEHIFQYDLTEQDWAATRDTIATYDGFSYRTNEYGVDRKTHFGPMMLGPDHRIYAIVPGNSRYLNVIDFPNELGVAASVNQHKIMIPTDHFSGVPNLPHYTTGPIDSSTCDTLGIDGFLRARFCYLEDSMDYLNIRFTDVSYTDVESWEWDFGDGSTYSGERPYFHRYDQDGAYEVCLTVTRNGLDDTFCKTLYLGVTSIADRPEANVVVDIYPNPVGEVLQFYLRDLIPNRVKASVYNTLGQRVATVVAHSQINHIAIEGHPAGMYYLVLQSAHGIISTSAFIKQ